VLNDGQFTGLGNASYLAGTHCQIRCGLFRPEKALRYVLRGSHSVASVWAHSGHTVLGVLISC